MENTANLGLKKPSGTDAPDISVINENMDTIDEAYAEMAHVEAGTDITEE